jgi:glycosyltransferase involved in cell wall biosynthesis
MANPTPDNLTVVICTRNRAEILKDCLSALAEQNGISQAQVLVVDNNSTDHTGEVARSFQDRLPNLKHVSEPRPGIANVRNAGIENTTTEYLAYLDDDVIPQPGWMGAVLGAFEATGADLVTGRVVPYWKGRRPWWVSKALYPILSGVDRGEDIVHVTDSFIPGANMAYRTSALREIGGFDVSLGVCRTATGDKTVYLGEEPDAARRLMAAGGRIAYTGKAVVHHLTTGERCSFRGLWRYAKHSGRTRALLKLADPVAVENECAWAAACLGSCLIRLHVRSAAFYYSRTLNCWYALREFRRLGQSDHSAALGFAKGALRLRKGLLGILRRTFFGKPIDAPVD